MTDQKSVSKVAIVGSRRYPETEESVKKVKKFIDPLFVWSDIDEIISGGAFGADTVAVAIAASLLSSNPDLGFKEFPADWRKNGRKAGYLRNVEIADYADELVAIVPTNGESKGTDMTIKLFEERGKTVHIMEFDMLIEGKD